MTLISLQIADAYDLLGFTSSIETLGFSILRGGKISLTENAEPLVLVVWERQGPPVESDPDGCVKMSAQQRLFLLEEVSTLVVNEIDGLEPEIRWWASPPMPKEVLVAIPISFWRDGGDRTQGYLKGIANRPHRLVGIINDEKNYERNFLFLVQRKTNASLLQKFLQVVLPSNGLMTDAEWEELRLHSAVAATARFKQQVKERYPLLVPAIVPW